MKTIEKIIELQKIDSQLQEIAELLGDLPVKVDKLKEEELSLTKSIDNGKNRLKELELNSSKLENQIKDINSKIEKHKDQLFLVTNNKQYDALQLEIDHLKTELDQLEITSLEYLEEKEQLIEKVKSEEENLGSLSDDLVERRTKLEGLMDESSDKKTKLESDRNNQIVNIDQSILSQYERIQNARGGISVVQVNSSACGGCGAFIPPQIISEVRLGENTQTCDSCSRFLYWDSE